MVFLVFGEPLKTTDLSEMLLQKYIVAITSALRRYRPIGAYASLREVVRVRTTSPRLVSALHPSAKLCCSKSVRDSSKQGRSTSERRATQTLAMRKISASKQRHERCLKGGHAFKEIVQCPFPADGITYQQRKKIDGFIAAEASSCQTDSMSNR
jgi:hypothetical protein